MGSDLLLLLIIGFAVGALIGAVGIGGILLIPALATFGALGMHEAMATALFTFAFTGIAGTLFFQRKGSIDWRITVPVCTGSLLFGFAGAWVNARISPQLLQFLLALIILFAGSYALASPRVRNRAVLDDVPRAQKVLLTLIGAVTGFSSGLTGVGGPVISVPLMVALGFPVLASIGASQVIQIIASLSGTIGNIAFGFIDFGLAVPVAIAEVGGIFAGGVFAHAVNELVLQRCVALLCIAVGVSLVVR